MGGGNHEKSSRTAYAERADLPSGRAGVVAGENGIRTEHVWLHPRGGDVTSRERIIGSWHGDGWPVPEYRGRPSGDYHKTQLSPDGGYELRPDNAECLVTRSSARKMWTVNRTNPRCTPFPWPTVPSDGA